MDFKQLAEVSAAQGVSVALSLFGMFFIATILAYTLKASRDERKEIRTAAAALIAKNDEMHEAERERWRITIDKLADGGNVESRETNRLLTIISERIGQSNNTQINVPAAIMERVPHNDTAPVS